MGKKKTFSTRIDADRLKALKHLAVDEDKSIGTLLEEAIDDLIQKYNQMEGKGEEWRDGKIIPTFLAVIEIKEDTAADEDTAYAFELKLLDGRKFSEQLYLDEQKQVYKRLASQDNLYTLKRTDVENIAREFPEHAERILRNYQMLK